MHRRKAPSSNQHRCQNRFTKFGLSKWSHVVILLNNGDFLIKCAAQPPKYRARPPGINRIPSVLMSALSLPPRVPPKLEMEIDEDRAIFSQGVREPPSPKLVSKRNSRAPTNEGMIPLLSADRHCEVLQSNLHERSVQRKKGSVQRKLPGNL